MSDKFYSTVGNPDKSTYLNWMQQLSLHEIKKLIKKYVDERSWSNFQQEEFKNSLIEWIQENL